MVALQEKKRLHGLRLKKKMTGKWRYRWNEGGEEVAPVQDVEWQREVGRRPRPKLATATYPFQPPRRSFHPACWYLLPLLRRVMAMGTKKL
ncbi:CoA transferase [Sesbania bispinosa]|nr:CoA transferase [Sesbania bispinosa]